MNEVESESFTMIIQFEVPPQNQAAFVADLADAVEHTIATLPGFRSAAFHVSHGGTRVINYAQWDSAETYQRSMQLDAARRARVGDIIELHDARVVHGDAYRIARTLRASRNPAEAPLNPPSSQA